MQLALLAAELATQLTIQGLVSVWRECDGVTRAQRKLERLERRGLVVLDSNPEPHGRIVRITEAGRLAALGGRDPETQWGRAWDGRWRIAVFDVPECHTRLRMRLRRKLRSMHFGYLQDSVWISPDPADVLKEALAGRKIDVEMLTLIEGRPCGGESDADLVAGTWNFDRINQKYEIYMELLRTHPLGSIRTPGRRQAWRHWLRLEWRAWTAVVREDPMLPEPLLPARYLGREAWVRRRALLRGMPLQLPEP